MHAFSAREFSLQEKVLKQAKGRESEDPMFLHIFVPLDGSAQAERALDLAALLARQTRTLEPALEPLLILFQAVDLSPWLDLDDRQGERTRATEAATRYLEVQARRLRSQGITVETAVRQGHPADDILEQTMARQVELIVMSTHGRSGLARWALGSVAERVARSVSVPLLLLPDAAPATTIALEIESTEAMPQMLVPLDGSAKAEAILPAAIEMARLLHAEVRLLYVFVPRFEECNLEETQHRWDTGRRRVHQIERYLMRQATIIQRAGIKAHWTLEYGMPGAKIIDTAYSYQVSLMAMTTQGRGGLVRWRLGSVTEEVLHAGLLPVLLFSSSGVEVQRSAEVQEKRALTEEAFR